MKMFNFSNCSVGKASGTNPQSMSAGETARCDGGHLWIKSDEDSLVCLNDGEEIQCCDWYDCRDYTALELVEIVVDSVKVKR